MTYWTLIRRSLRFHARAHLGVVLGAAVGSAALIGALVVGDSVRESLTDMALRRLGSVHFALATPDRLFNSSLPGRLATADSENPRRVAVPFPSSLYPFPGTLGFEAMLMAGVVTRQDGAARASGVTVLGVDPQSWPRLADWGETSDAPRAPALYEDGTSRSGLTDTSRARGESPLSRWIAGDAAFINEALARQLGAKIGDDIIVRVRKPTALGLDAAISTRNEDSVALRIKVGAILSPAALGDFALSSQPASARNLFLPLGFLADRLGATHRANLIVTGPVPALRLQSGLDTLRETIALWLWRHAPRQRLGPAGTAATVWVPDTTSLAVRVARAITPNHEKPLPDSIALPWLKEDLNSAWLPEDPGLAVGSIEQPRSATGGEYIQPTVEVSSSRIFIEPQVASAALTPRTTLLTNHVGFHADGPADLAFAPFVTNGVQVLTYLANLIRAGDRSTPYSMVTAADKRYVPADMRDDEIIVNQWLADDLQVKPGDSVALSYYVVDSGSRLVERTNSFRVRDIVPLKGIYADRTLMPEFPGLAKAESTHDWDAGFPLVHPIRPKDEAYWKAYRGTPKAFVTLAAGQAMWANRFGTLTAIRYAVPTNTVASTCRDAVYRNLLANLKPEDFGLRFEPVREQALKAAAQGQDFGQLFLGFSIFVIVAALLLMALLFQFGLEQRAAEVGILLAVGLTPRKVRRLLLLEGVALALVGGAVGALGGIAYARAMLWGLNTLWRSAVGSADLQFHATGASLFTGFLASATVAALTIWLTLRKQARQPVPALLAGEIRTPKSEGRNLARWIAWGAGVGAVALVGWALASGQNAAPGVFFGAGSLLLIAGLAAAATWLARVARPSRSTLHAPRSTPAPVPLTLGALGLRGCARRRRRSLATIALLACGAFLIAAIGAFRLDANRDATRRDSGTGGFALIGESTLPVTQDLNTKAGRDFYGLDAKQLAGVNVVPLRVHEGDAASCLNLNRAQRPRLLGVKPELLAGRFTFSAAAKGLDRRKGWRLLSDGESRIVNRKSQIPEVPAIGDANAIEWAMGKALGDTIPYTDEQGRKFNVRLVGAVANSILQGSLLINEAEFTRRFPNESGYRMFLVDAPSNSVAQVSATLSRALQDAGLELTPAARRLNEFNAVQNTYLGTFQVLGGLGLLLGSAGLGIVVLRNVLERRGELGLLTAVGFRRRLLQRLVLSEHGALLAFGLALGTIAAAVAVLPAILSPGTHLPYASLALTLAIVLLNGLLWTWLATAYALKGNLLAALRNE
ncbi:MAG TPA: FtsX-like permease family protein [Candidatus Acidoferrum sp.]|nr:FtsX-like permease family protein [Candidatus Acidoferrum sp.]